MKRTGHVTKRRAVKQVRPGPAKARGAALTEAFLVSMILVPLLFGTAMIGKLIDTRQTAVQAGRYAVWESTVHGSAAPPDDVHARFFTRDGAAVPHASAGGAGSGDAVDDDSRDDVADWPLRDVRGRTRVAIGSSGATALAYDDTTVNTNGTPIASAVGEAVHGAGNLLRGASGGEWNISANGFVRGRVAVPLDTGSWIDGGTLAESAVIMNDGWSASGTEQLERRTKSFVPAGALESVADILSAVSVVPVLKELRGLEGALGKVDARALPEGERHELKPYSETAP